MLYYQSGSENTIIGPEELQNGLYSALDRLGPKKRVLVIPPDFTRFHSRAGEITSLLYKYYGEKLSDILPALGTHFPMSDSELDTMFPGVPKELFRVHDWRRDVVTAGIVPGNIFRKLPEVPLTIHGRPSSTSWSTTAVMT